MNMAENNETKNTATPDGAQAKNPHHRRGRYNRRPGNRRPNPGDGEVSGQENTTVASAELAEGDGASEVSEQTENNPSSRYNGGEHRPRRRSRGRRGGRNRGTDAQTDAQTEADTQRTEQDVRDEETSAELPETEYEETERDIIGREVHEIVSEERIAAAVEEQSADTDNEEASQSDAALPDTPEVEKVPVEVVGVRFKAAGKVYYFDPDGQAFRDGDTVIVETARGMEFGFAVGGNRTVMAADLVSPLKKVLRMATDEDRQHYDENNIRREEAFNICREKIAEHNIDMKLVDVEYTFDNNKLLFYFTADGRVDFRELVKDLASIFRTRIELRQIGIRDEAKLMGGLGVCGRPFCCHSFLSDFVQVSIKMAKEQNLSLNSAKISGTCGRLMCCLRYEYDVYEEELKKTPKLDAVVDTPDGEGVVCEVIPLAGLIRVKFIGSRSDATPKLYHRDDVKVKGKMNWKSGNITYHDTETK